MYRPGEHGILIYKIIFTEFLLIGRYEKRNLLAFLRLQGSKTGRIVYISSDDNLHQGLKVLHRTWGRVLLGKKEGKFILVSPQQVHEKKS